MPVQNQVHFKDDNEWVNSQLDYLKEHRVDSPIPKLETIKVT
jgi:hypothetical protein